MGFSFSSHVETAIFGGGCFWCTEAVFQQVKGVKQVTSGYSGGETANPSYNEVTTGETGHAEVVKIVFDPEVISFEELLYIFFEIHDPTTLNRQGADIGTQYRSVIFYASEKQKETAHDVIDKINKKLPKTKRVVTEVTPFTAFYDAEKYHQNYYQSNKMQPYCRFVIKPKMEKFDLHFEEFRR